MPITPRPTGTSKSPDTSWINKKGVEPTLPSCTRPKSKSVTAMSLLPTTGPHAGATEKLDPKKHVTFDVAHKSDEDSSTTDDHQIPSEDEDGLVMAPSDDDSDGDSDATEGFRVPDEKAAAAPAAVVVPVVSAAAAVPVSPANFGKKQCKLCLMWFKNLVRHEYSSDHNSAMFSSMQEKADPEKKDMPDRRHFDTDKQFASAIRRYVDNMRIKTSGPSVHTRIDDVELKMAQTRGRMTKVEDDGVKKIQGLRDTIKEQKVKIDNLEARLSKQEKRVLGNPPAEESSTKRLKKRVVALEEWKKEKEEEWTTFMAKMEKVTEKKDTGEIVSMEPRGTDYVDVRLKVPKKILAKLVV